MKISKIIAFGFLILCLSLSLNARELPKYLLDKPEIVKIDTLETNDFFQEKYIITVKQYLDYKHPELGSFEQRVFISHYDFNSPMVFVTEGYVAKYAESAKHIDELASIFKANQVVVEHRYFGESVPENVNYEYLTTENAAGDHHSVFLLLKDIYKSKWVATGISKGGETALLYNMYHPEDMDATVAYVAPNAYGVGDLRHGKFLKKVAKSSDRKAVLNFQKEVLKRKDKLMPMFNEYSNSKNYTYRLSNEEIFDYCVLEFSFAFWQWGASPKTIPNKDDSDQKLFYYLIGIAGPSYFAIEDIEPTFPFFYQAARELGYYAYDTKALKKYLSIESAENYLHKIFLPEDMQIEYDPSTSERLTKFIQTTSNKIALVYGEYDPWTAAQLDFCNNPSIVKILIPQASHAGRIRSLSKDKYNEYVSIIGSWLR